VVAEKFVPRGITAADACWSLFLWGLGEPQYLWDKVSREEVCESRTRSQSTHISFTSLTSGRQVAHSTAPRRGCRSKYDQPFVHRQETLIVIVTRHTRTIRTTKTGYLVARFARSNQLFPLSMHELPWLIIA
jgi:hypothetical protein